MTYRTSPRRDASPLPLPPAVSRAFDDQAARSLRVGALRVVILLPFLGVALWLRHWAAWVVFGVVAFLQLLPAILLFGWVRPRSRRAQRTLEKDASRVVWLHTEPEARSKLHRIELHDRAGEVETVFTDEATARSAADAMRAHAIVTTTAEERAAAEPRLRLAGKLVKLDEESASAEPPRLREQRGNVEAFLAAWDARIERDGGAAIAPEIERRVDQLLHYYHATRIGEPGRRRRSESIGEDEREVLDAIFARELFTDDIAKLLVELNELASSRRA